MKIFSKKHTIKIPEDITVLYNDNIKIITFIGPTGRRSLNLKVKINLLTEKRIIQVSKISFLKMSNNQKKTLKAIQGTTVALIKQIILEISVILYKKLKLVGVGYRVFVTETHSNQILNFKLGYSHQIYFKIPKNFNAVSSKTTNLFIFGNSYQYINQISSLIKSYKYPEPYKGKGILYENEKITIKEGKKV